MAKIKNWPDGYQEKLEEILGIEISTKVSISWPYDEENPTEITLLQKKLRHMQKQLRMLKTEVNNDMKVIRANYSAQKEKVSGGGFFTSLIAGKKAAGRIRQSQREAIRRSQANDLTPYQNVKSTIDTLLLELDRIKLELEQTLLNAKK